MALAWSLLDSSDPLETSEPVTTASISPAAGSLVYLFVAVASNASSTKTVDADFGGGVTWTLVGTQIYASRRQMWVYRSDDTPGAGTLSIDVDVTSSTFQELGYAVVQAAGIDTTTPNDAAVSGAATGPSSPYSASDVGTPDSGDAVVAFFCYENGAGSLSVGGDEVEYVEGGSNLRGFIIGWDQTATPDETPALTHAENGDAAYIAFTLNAAAGGGGTTYEEAVTLQASAALDQGALGVLTASLSLPATAAQAASANLVMDESVALDATASVSPTGILTLSEALNLAAQAIYGAAAYVSKDESIALAASAAITTAAIQTLEANLALAATGDLTAAGIVDMLADLNLGVSATMTAESVATLEAALALPVSANLLAEGNLAGTAALAALLWWFKTNSVTKH